MGILGGNILGALQQGLQRIWLLLSILWHWQNIAEANDNYHLCMNRFSPL